MALINDLVQKTLKTGYLTIEAEEQLRQLLTTEYDLEDLNAFVILQEAAMTGHVKQESRERHKSMRENIFSSNSSWRCIGVEQY